MKKIQLLIDELDKKLEEKMIVKSNIPQEQVNRIMKKKQVSYPKGYQGFLLQKYINLIIGIIIELKNDNLNIDFFWKDNEYNIESQKKLTKNMVFIEEIELFKLFKKKLEEDNCYYIDPFVFKASIDRISKPSRFRYYPMEYQICQQFFLDKIKIQNKEMLRIIY